MMNQQRDILLIQKDSAMREAGQKMLAAAGYSVHPASSMRDALSVLSTEQIGLIVCDLELEDIRATDFLSYLKKDPLRESIPFVFFIHSQNAGSLPSARALELGAVDLIVYPVEAHNFIDRIRKRLPHAGGTHQIADAGPQHFPESFLPRPEEKTDAGNSTDKKFEDALVSLNGRQWTDCHIINHTFHGAMVETRLRGKQGSSVLLRYNLPDAPLTARGRLIHILLGDHERPMGMGINFRGDPNWRQIHTRIKSAAESPGTPGEVKIEPSPPALSPPEPVPEQSPPPSMQKASPADDRIRPEVPIGIEVSRDAALWMYGEIVGYGRRAASITTPILGKPGEVLHIRYTMPGGQLILKGNIEKVTLNNFKMPAGMEVNFPEEKKWSKIVADLSGNEVSHPSDGSISHPVPTQTPSQPPKSVHQTVEKEMREQGWTQTIAVTKEPPRTESIKNRFYKSLIGKKLGSYEIVSFLSAGGMGGVFRGWDIALERDVAIKVISYELSSQHEFVEMFFKEARLVSKLNHPNIAHIYFIGNESGIVYYAMEFIHGRTLAELVTGGRGIQTEKAVGYLADACRALDRVWMEKIIHRDIKPANIMISEHGAVKVLDFGVAQQQKKGAVKAEANIVGSPPYLSPEMIREQPVDLRSDIYSLGATFYHVLNGSPPFMDSSLEGILRKHLDASPTPLKEKLPSLPSRVSDIIHKMLEKNPEDRFQSYQEIIEALAAFTR